MLITSKFLFMIIWFILMIIYSLRKPNCFTIIEELINIEYSINKFMGVISFLMFTLWILVLSLYIPYQLIFYWIPGVIKYVAR